MFSTKPDTASHCSQKPKTLIVLVCANSRLDSTTNFIVFRTVSEFLAAPFYVLVISCSYGRSGVNTGLNSNCCSCSKLKSAKMF